MADICLHCFVSGHVQGVFYRRHTHEQALKHQITGWVRNTADGRVEVLLCGEESKVMLVRDWLYQGPERARVTDVTFSKAPWQNFKTFEVQE